MKKLTKLETFGLIAAILIGGSYFYMKKVYDPEAAALKKTISRLNATIKEYNNLQDPPDSRSIQRQLEKLDKEAEELAVQVRQAGGRTEAASEITEALQDISREAKFTGLRVVHLSLGEEKKDELFTWKTLNLELEGQFGQFVLLVKRLKELERPVQLLDLQMSASEASSGEVTIRAALWI